MCAIVLGSIMSTHCYPMTIPSLHWLYFYDKWQHLQWPNAKDLFSPPPTWPLWGLWYRQLLPETFCSINFNGTTLSKIPSASLTILSQSSLLAPISLLVLDVPLFSPASLPLGSSLPSQKGLWVILTTFMPPTPAFIVVWIPNLHHKSIPAFKSINRTDRTWLMPQLCPLFLPPCHKQISCVSTGLPLLVWCLVSPF